MRGCETRSGRSPARRGSRTLRAAARRATKCLPSSQAPEAVVSLLTYTAKRPKAPLTPERRTALRTAAVRRARRPTGRPRRSRTAAPAPVADDERPAAARRSRLQRRPGDTRRGHGARRTCTPAAASGPWPLPASTALKRKAHEWWSTSLHEEGHEGHKRRRTGVLSRVLVAYGTTNGSTAQTTEAITDVLRKDGLTVEAMSARSVTPGGEGQEAERLPSRTLWRPAPKGGVPSPCTVGSAASGAAITPALPEWRPPSRPGPGGTVGTCPSSERRTR